MHRLAQLKIRVPEWLRLRIEREAADAGRSMNAEIVRRLSESVSGQDRASIAAEAILSGVDKEIAKRMEEMILDAAAEKAGDLYMSMYDKYEKEGGDAQDDTETKGE
jgi:hypothetical protein